MQKAGTKIFGRICFALFIWMLSDIGGDRALAANAVTLNAENKFTLTAPKGTKFIREQGVDSFVGKFTHPEFEIGFDYGWYSYSGSELTQDSRYTTRNVTIDRRPAAIITGPSREQSCKGQYAGLFIPAVSMADGDPTRLYMRACVYDAERLPVLIGIFESLRFKKP